MSLSYRNQSIDLPIKSIDWFLYASDLCHEKVKESVSGKKLYMYVVSLFLAFRKFTWSELYRYLNLLQKKPPQLFFKKRCS